MLELVELLAVLLELLKLLVELLVVMLELLELLVELLVVRLVLLHGMRANIRVAIPMS
jgi:hypothetical protein